LDFVGCFHSQLSVISKDEPSREKKKPNPQSKQTKKSPTPNKQLKKPHPDPKAKLQISLSSYNCN